MSSCCYRTPIRLRLYIVQCTLYIVQYSVQWTFITNAFRGTKVIFLDILIKALRQCLVGAETIFANMFMFISAIAVRI